MKEDNACTKIVLYMKTVLALVSITAMQMEKLEACSLSNIETAANLELFVLEVNQWLLASSVNKYHFGHS